MSRTEFGLESGSSGEQSGSHTKEEGRRHEEQEAHGEKKGIELRDLRVSVVKKVFLCFVADAGLLRYPQERAGCALPSISEP